MKVIKYIIERQMIYSIDNRSLIYTLDEFDNLEYALEELENEAQFYANNKNIVIEIVKYEYDLSKHEYEYLYKVIGFYGVEAAKYLNIRSKMKKYGLILV